MNYPRIWLTIGNFLGNNPTNLAMLGSIVGLFGFTIYSFRRNQVLSRVFIFNLSILSPVTLLGIERGNIEIGVLGLCAIGLLLVTQDSKMYQSFGVVTLLIASILKLFPGLLLVALFVISCKSHNSRDKSLKKSTALSLIAFLIYLYFTRQDLEAIRNGTPTAPTYSFGAGQTLTLLKTVGLSPFLNGVLYLISITFLIVTFGIFSKIDFRTLLKSISLPKFFHSDDLARQRLFLATVLVAGTLPFSNWPYRYVFMFLLLPPLIDMQEEKMAAGFDTINLVKTMVLLIPVFIALQVTQDFSRATIFLAAIVTPLIGLVIVVCLALSCKFPCLEKNTEEHEVGTRS